MGAALSLRSANDFLGISDWITCVLSGKSGADWAASAARRCVGRCAVTAGGGGVAGRSGTAVVKRTRRTREDYSLQRRARRRRSRRPAVRIRRSSVIFILPRTIFRVTSPIGPGSLPKAAVPSLTEICTGGVAVPCSAQIFSVIAAVCPDSSGDGTPLRCLRQHDASRTHNACCFSFPAAFPAAQMAPVLPADASIPAFPAERTTNCGVGGRPRDSGNFTCSEGSAAQSVRAGRVACPASVAVRRHFVSFLPAALRRLTRFAAPPGVKNNTQFCQRTAV